MLHVVKRTNMQTRDHLYFHFPGETVRLISKFRIFCNLPENLRRIFFMFFHGNTQITDL